MSTLLAEDCLAVGSGSSWQLPWRWGAAPVVERMPAPVSSQSSSVDTSLQSSRQILWSIWTNAGSSIVLATAGVERRLRELYEWVRPRAIAEFFQHNPTVPMLLLEAFVEIERHFGRSRVSLHVTTDPDGNDAPRLVVRVHTALPPKEALPRLDAFDEEWWLDASLRGGDRVCITLAYQ